MDDDCDMLQACLLAYRLARFPFVGAAVLNSPQSFAMSCIRSEQKQMKKKTNEKKMQITRDSRCEPVIGSRAYEYLMLCGWSSYDTSDRMHSAESEQDIGIPIIVV